MVTGLSTSNLIGITPPQAIVNGASWTTGEIDCLGFEYLHVCCYCGAMDAAFTALAVTESDTSGSGHANVTGGVFGTSENTDGDTSTLPSATDDNKFFVFDIDLRGRKRYIDLTATIDTGSTGGFLCAWGVLSRGHSTPMSAAQRGASQILRV